MTPQDPQTSPAAVPSPTNTPLPGDIGPQIPASYAPSSSPLPIAPIANPDTAPITNIASMGNIGNVGGSSALQDALDAQLAAPEPDPMAGFGSPATINAVNIPSPSPTTPLTVATNPVAAQSVDPAMLQPNMPQPTPTPIPTPYPNPEPTLADISRQQSPIVPDLQPPASSVVPQANPISQASQSVPALTPELIPAPAPVTPAPVEAYDPAQESGAGAPATSYPDAPTPLPPNPLEATAAAALDTPPPVSPAIDQAYVSPPVQVPTTAAVELAPLQAPIEAPVYDSEPMIDPITGTPMDPSTSMAMQPAAVDMGGNVPLQSMLDDPNSTIDPYTDPALLASAYPTSSPSGGGIKGILVGIGIGLGVLVVGIVLLALILGRKTTTDLSADNLTSPTGTGSSNSSSTPNIKLPDGYVAISRDCYVFGLPTDNNITKDTNCNLDGTFGSQGVSKITVIPHTEAVNSLAEGVASIKSSYNLTISKESKVSLGGIDANEIIFTTDTDPQTTKFIVYLKDKNYTFGGEKVTGMEINISSNDTFSQAARDTLLSTWSWK